MKCEKIPTPLSIDNEIIDLLHFDNREIFSELIHLQSNCLYRLKIHQMLHILQIVHSVN